MTGKSHLTAGTALTIAALHQGNYMASPDLWLALAIGVGMVASLLPDSDTPNPMIRSMVRGGGQPRLMNKVFYGKTRHSLFYKTFAALELLVRGILAILLGIIPGLVKHRGPTHFLLTAVGLTGLLWFISVSLGWSLMFTLAFSVGYLSHIWCDTMTRSGVPIFGPITRKKVYSLPFPLRLRTEQTANLTEMIAVLLIILLAGSAFIIPNAVQYLLLVAVIISGMFVVTAVDDTIRQRNRRRKGE